MAFALKGLYFTNQPQYADIVQLLAQRLVAMYRNVSTPQWHWFENYLTYGNSVLPEAMMCAFELTHQLEYRKIALQSFDFLLSIIWVDGQIKVISNQGWLIKDTQRPIQTGGEQPIDVAYTLLALSRFYHQTHEQKYVRYMHVAFQWFLGHNMLNQTMYNPCTGGCYDGLEDDHVNLNQGAESAVSYAMARITMAQLITSNTPV